MRARTSIAALTVSALIAAGGNSGSHKAARTHTTTALAGPAAAEAPRVSPRPPRVQALVTAETENRLLVVDLPSGRVVRRIPVAPDPEDLATDGKRGEIVVVSAAAGKITLLGGEALRPLKVLSGFDQPHIAAVAPDGQHAYVTDDARGTLTAIDLANLRVTSTIHVGAGAHHLCFDLKDQTRGSRSASRRRSWSS